MFLKQAQSVPNKGTSFLHYITDFKKEIVSEHFGGTGDDFAVEMGVLKNFVDIASIAMHLLGEPLDRSALFVENLFDDMSYMNLRHSCVYKNRGLLSETEVLEYLLSQQESPRLKYVGDLLSWRQR